MQVPHHAVGSPVPPTLASSFHRSVTSAIPALTAPCKGRGPCLPPGPAGSAPSRSARFQTLAASFSTIASPFPPWDTGVLPSSTQAGRRLAHPSASTAFTAFFHARRPSFPQVEGISAGPAMAKLRMQADGLALPLPAMSGAEPCAPVHTAPWAGHWPSVAPRLGRGQPCRGCQSAFAARFRTAGSPKQRLSVTMDVELLGPASSAAFAPASAYMCDSSTSGYSASWDLLHHVAPASTPDSITFWPFFRLSRPCCPACGAISKRRARDRAILALGVSAGC